MAAVVNYTVEDIESLSVASNPYSSADASRSAPVTTVEGVAMFESQTILPVGIVSGEAWGNPVLTTTVTVFPSGIASAEAWGTPTVTANQLIAPSGIPSAEAWGTPAISLFILPSGIASGEAWGTPEIDTTYTIYPVGIVSGEAWGTPSLRNPGPVRPVTRNTIVVPCRVKSCANEVSDLTIYNLQDALVFNGTAISILENCPTNYYCQPGTFPHVFTYPPETFSVVVPPAGQAFPVVLSATGCEGLITRVAPARASAAALAALANSIINELAAQQARCDALLLASPRVTTTTVTPPTPPCDIVWTDIVWTPGTVPSGDGSASITLPGNMPAWSFSGGTGISYVGITGELTYCGGPYNCELNLTTSDLADTTINIRIAHYVDGVLIDILADVFNPVANPYSFVVPASTPGVGSQIQVIGLALPPNFAATISAGVVTGSFTITKV